MIERKTCRKESRGMGLEYLKITGGVPLCGELTVQGSKNAALPVLAACLLGDDVCILQNCPVISDVDDTLKIMETLGCRIRREGSTVCVDASGVNQCEILGPEAARIRSSILFLGALLGKMGKAVLPMPGGCAIGARPIDLHLKVLEELGANIFIDEKITAEGVGLRGRTVSLALPSVGATENAILASVLARGRTVIQNAAREPEIDELCRFLKLRGAQIVRQEDGEIRIDGVQRLYPVRYRMRADRIVSGTYLLAAASAGGSVRICNFPHGELTSLLEVLHKIGVRIRIDGSSLTAEAVGSLRALPHLETAPYPGFPTDLQSQLMAVLCRAEGRSCICEQIFENRFRTADALRKMGAEIRTEGRCAWITGVRQLRGAQLKATDLRGGAALVIAALGAKGDTFIGETAYIARGYENICRDLRLLGAKITCGDDAT